MCKVTLTNWNRKSNAPIDLSKCFAVQWRREFIAVCDSDGNTLLYNVKWNMWSQLPKLPGSTRPCMGCPLTCYDDKLLILVQEGKMCELLAEKNVWRVNQTLTSADGFGGNLDVAVLAAGSENMLFVISSRRYNNYGSNLQVFDGCHWSDPVSLQLNVLERRLEQKHIFVAVHEMTIYVSNEDTIYRIHIPIEKRVPKDPEATLIPGSSNGEGKAVAQNVPTSLTPTNIPLRKRKVNDDQNLNLGIPVKIPKLDTNSPDLLTLEAMDLDNVVTTKVSCPFPMKSPLCAVGGYLFAFGGKDEDNQPFSSIYRFVEETNMWKEAGYMTTARYGAAVATFQHKDEDVVDVFVIGGYLGENSKMKLGCCITDKCELSVTKN